ncbi:Putative reverse transcriptase [Desulfonema limicola]|uniref:Reverse transcriptase n=1 Tax=Desulfonema limicola TaxID=45656 RepID=A0A975GIV2_9BACT|nr:Putative reverse transcriptase [Desulfonema limicola]
MIPERENLCLAFWKAATGRHDRDNVIEFKRNFENNIQTMAEQLLKNKLDIGHYRFFSVRDPKPRSICAAAFPERVLHHAIMNICEPVLESYAIHDSYACRKNKGSLKALEKAQKYSRRYEWFLKMDIRKYFDSIDHSIMMTMLSRRFKEKKLLNLFQQLFNTYHTEKGKGMPIGNLISQHLANFYLGSLDHYLKDKRGNKAYLRYMDDFVLFGHEKEYLKKELAEIQVFLKQGLALKLKDNTQLNRSYKGFPFLGYRIFPHKRLLLPASKKRFLRKFIKYEKNYIKGCWTQQELIRHMEPLIEFTRAADASGFRHSVIQRFGAPF